MRSDTTKDNTIRFIRDHLEDYVFPSNERELKREFQSLSFTDDAACVSEQVEKCYKKFFNLFDNNIFYTKYRIEKSCLKNKITCKKVTGHFVFCKDESRYIPIYEFRENRSSSDQALMSTFHDIWKKFAQELKGYQPVFKKNLTQIPNRYRYNWLYSCTKRLQRTKWCLSIMVLGLFLIHNVLCSLGVKWKFGVLAVWVLAFGITTIGVIRVKLNNWITCYEYCQIAEKMKEVDTSEEFPNMIFSEIWKDQDKDNDSYKRFRLDEIRASVENLSKQNLNKIKKRRREFLKEIDGENRKIMADTIVGILLLVFLSNGEQLSRIAERQVENMKELPVSETEIVVAEPADIEETLPALTLVDSYAAITGYQSTLDKIEVYEQPDEYSTKLNDLNIQNKQKINILEEYETERGELWYKVVLPQGKKGWVNRKKLKYVYKNELDTAAEQITDQIESIPELCDGNLENVWEMPEDFMQKNGEICLQLNDITPIEGLIFYNGNYNDNVYSQYGKVTEIVVCLDDKEEIPLRVEEQYNLKGQLIPIKGEAKAITIRLVKTQPGFSKNKKIREKVCISDIVVLGSD